MQQLTTSLAPRLGRESPPAGVVRVLVVGDEHQYAGQLEALLLGMGYETVGPAVNAQIALALHKTESIDLVVLDISLRGPANGIQLAGQLLAHGSVPIIFLTAFTDEATFEQAREVGPVAYLIKPVETGVLRRAISLAVRNFAAISWPLPASAPGRGAPFPAAVFIKENGILEKVCLSDIHTVEAANKMCHLALAERSISVRMSLRELAQYLPAERFVQIQRSYFVNIEHIDRLDPTRYLVQVGKQLLPVGRLYLPALISRLCTIT